MKTRHFLQALGLGLAWPATDLFAQANANAGRPIRMIVPLPAGTSNDTATRTFAPAMGQLLGQTVVVDNKAGANGVIGTMDVVRAAPDGLTLMCGSLSPLSTNVAFVKNLPYDLRKDVTPIAATTMTNHVMLVRGDSPIRTFADFIAHARRNPGKVSVGSSTALVQLQIATINKMAGVQLLTVPYKGAPATVTDVIGGTLDATMGNPGPAIQLVKAGQLRAIAVTSLKRNPVTPDWPAVSETLPGFEFPAWNAVVGPAHMPRELVNRLSAAITQALARPDVQQQLAGEATVPLVMGPDQLRAYMDSEITKYVRLAQENGLQPE